MARSQTIWLVMQAGLPVAAFTVKHELASWLEMQPHRSHLTLFRCPDKPSWHPDYYEAPVQVTAAEVLSSTAGFRS